MIILKMLYSIRYYALLLMFTLVGLTARAQRPSHEKLESVRIAMITERLSLTPETAQRFWPIYHGINEERQKLKHESRQQRRSTHTDSLSDEQARKWLEAYFDLKRQELALEEKAVEQYQAVLSPVQVVQLLRTEHDFRHMMLKQLGRRGRRTGTEDNKNY